MLKIKYHASFKKDYKKVVKRGYNIKLMEDIIHKLANGEQLPEKNHDHSLSGEQDAESVILHRTGFLSTKLITEN